MDTHIECCIEYVEDYMKVLYISNTKVKQIEGGVFVVMTKLAAEEASDALDEGKTVLVARGINGVIEFTDLFITDSDDLLQIQKDGICYRARMHMNNEMAMLKAFDFFEFTIFFFVSILTLHKFSACTSEIDFSAKKEKSSFSS